jgi:hypothetical protein
MPPRDIVEKLQYGEVVIHGAFGKSVYRKIFASEARNSDGTLAGWEAGTPAGDRQCIEKAFTPKGSKKTKYTNYW